MGASSKEHLNTDIPKGKTGIKRVYGAFFYSIDGLISCFRHEAAFRQEVCLAFILIPIAFLMRVSHVETLLLVGSVMLVLLTELLNSSIEAIVDKVVTEFDPLAKRSKDMGSAAVLVSILWMSLVWIWILYQHFFNKS